MPEITIRYDAEPDAAYPYRAIAAISEAAGQNLPVSEMTWTRLYDDPARDAERKTCACDLRAPGLGPDPTCPIHAEQGDGR